MLLQCNVCKTLYACKLLCVLVCEIVYRMDQKVSHYQIIKKSYLIVFSKGVVPLRHLRHVPPQTVWRLWLIVYRTIINSITLCVTLNANTGKIVFVTLCIQIEWLFYNAFLV